jgi:Zn-dependent M28 family amino/carboxypeptidase
MNRSRRHSLPAAVLLVGLTACGSSLPSVPPSSAPAATATATAHAGPTETPIVASAPPGSGSAGDRIGADLAALQGIADASNGIRATGTAGYEASVDFAASELREIGFQVDTPEVAFTAFGDLGAVLEVGGRAFSGPDEVRALIYSPGGLARGRVIHLEGSGCEARHFHGLNPGDLALTTEGGCFRRDQVLNAVEAGAAALLVGYPGRGPGEIYRPTLLEPGGMDVPAVSVTDEAVALLTGPAGQDVRLEVTTELRSSTFRNVIGQLGDGPRVVMVGAHLDSVLDGPGINDNGSGVAAVLEIGRSIAAAGMPDGWALRIGLWGAEELGTIGSTAYAESVGDEVVAYLNLDMAGSLNGATLVYDEGTAASGSDAITDAFQAVLAARGEPSQPTDLGGSSDHFGFQQSGIPTGGLFAGATRTGGAAAPSAGGSGPDPDPCYHIACDDLDNVDIERVVLFAEVTAAVVRDLMADG